MMYEAMIDFYRSDDWHIYTAALSYMMAMINLQTYCLRLQEGTPDPVPLVMTFLLTLLGSYQLLQLH